MIKVLQPRYQRRPAQPRLCLRHEGARQQTRASGDPYFSHPLEVAAILTDLKLDDATIVAALLHDTIEDTEATRAEIDSCSAPKSARWSRASPS
jgi:(p)ppGpp synthase/HD superfamily hydrolase